MACAIIGGLLRTGMTAQQIDVVEPFAPARERLLTEFGITAHAAAELFPGEASMVIWAVKPQMFGAAAQQAEGNVQLAGLMALLPSSLLPEPKISR